MKTNTCKTCNHWKAGQRELNYWPTIGFCLNPKFSFNVSTGRLIGVVDLSNEKDESVTGNPAHDFETMPSYSNIKRSRYLLATESNFGCNFHQGGGK